MRILFIGLAVLYSLNGVCQRDSTQICNPNIISVEIGGGSYFIYGWGNPFNIGYQRTISLKDEGLIGFSFRLGVSTFQSNISPPPESIRNYFFPIESSIMIGSGRWKGDFGVGYTPVIGKQKFRSASGIVDVYHYDFWTIRLGVVLRFYSLYLRLSWVPAFVPNYNPIPSETLNFGNWRIGWGGLTIGFSF